MLPVKVKNRNNNSSRYDANEHWTRKEKRSEVEVVIMDTNKKRRKPHYHKKLQNFPPRTCQEVNVFESRKD